MLHDHYPKADVMRQRSHWDHATRQVVLDRVHNVPEFKHFNAQQRATLTALCELIIPQAHRSPDKRVPLAPWIDDLCVGHAEPFRFDNMPPNDVAWDQGLEGIEQSAQALFKQPFTSLSADQRQEVLDAIHKGTPPGEVWQQLPAARWWEYIAVRQIAGVYYAHPLAWDEVGFGGPAYPRGYLSLNHGDREPWESEEVR